MCASHRKSPDFRMSALHRTRMTGFTAAPQETHRGWFTNSAAPFVPPWPTPTYPATMIAS